ncbi:MAG: tetratricopeptide repeat protein [Bacteroides sp.]|nr:tetratricopeptide repeat protein [Bacteroides sp.]
MRKILLITVITATLITAFAAAAPRIDRREAAASRAERKADMIFLEALLHKEQGEIDAYADLVVRAYETNPNDSFLGWEYGRIFIATADPADSTGIASAYKLMRDYAMEGEGATDFYTMSLMAQTAERQGYDNDLKTILHRLYENNPDRPEVAVNYAQRLAMTGRADDVKEALAVYDTIEAREGLSVPLSSLRMRTYLMQGDTAAILREARRLFSSSPTSAEYAVLAGDVYNQMQQSDSALAFYDKAIELDPTSGIAYYSRANLYLSRGDSTAYDQEIFIALGQPDLDVETKTELMRGYVSNLYREPSQRERITSLFNRLIDQHPHESSIHGLYGDYLAAIGEFAPAAEQLVYETDLNPSNVERWRMLCSLYLSLENYERAVATANTAMGFFPDDAQLPLMAASAMSNINRADEAIVLLRNAMGNPVFDDETRSNFITSIGDIMYTLEETDSAFTCYEEAIRLNPANYLAMNNCAYFLACNDRELDHALDLITKAVAGRPDDTTTLDTYAWVLFKRRDYEKAKEIIDRTLEISNDDGDEISAEILEHAGDIYFMLREPEQALEFWKKALATDPDSEILKRKVTHKTYFYE